MCIPVCCLHILRVLSFCFWCRTIRIKYIIRKLYLFVDRLTHFIGKFVLHISVLPVGLSSLFTRTFVFDSINNTTRLDFICVYCFTILASWECCTHSVLSIRSHMYATHMSITEVSIKSSDNKVIWERNVKFYSRANRRARVTKERVLQHLNLPFSPQWALWLLNLVTLVRTPPEKTTIPHH